MNNYQKKILQAAPWLNLRRGSTADIYVRHDAWCAIWERGDCTCDPDVTIVPADETQA